MNNGKKKLFLPLAAAACAVLLAGCGTTLGEHTNTYFSQMGNVIKTAISSAQAQKEVEANPTPTVDANALAAPANFTVDESGNYSFDAVENAQYYYVYVYDSETGAGPCAPLWPSSPRCCSTSLAATGAKRPSAASPPRRAPWMA